MKLLRYGLAGVEKPGLLDSSGRIRDLSAIVKDINGAFLSGEDIQRVAALDVEKLPLVTDDVRYGPCVASIGKFICIGLNYADHAAESNLAVPEEPVVFLKATSAIVGPNDMVLKPRGSTKLDWEVELGVVIGKRASYVSVDDAMNYIAG